MAPGRTCLDDVDVRYRALVDVAGALTSHSDLHDLLRSLRGHLEPIVQFTFLSVWLWERETERLTVAFFEPEESPAGRVIGESFAAAGTYPGQAIQSGRPIYVTDVDPAGPYPSRLMIEQGVQSYCAVPLVTARGPVGTLNFGSLDAHAYTPDDIELMSRVGSLVAVALENARSVDTIREQRAALQRERDQLDVLLEVTNAVVTHLDTRALFVSLAPALKRVCSAEFAALSLFDPETRLLRKHACQGPPELAGIAGGCIETPVDTSLSGQVFLTGQPRIFTRDDLLRHPETRRLVEFGALSACSVPLGTPQGTLGTLDLAAFDRDAFSPSLFGLLSRIAGQIAIAVRNATSYERIESLNAQLAREKLYLQDEIRSEQLFEDIVGGSAALRRVLKEIETVAPTDSTVLISGETGSGKELVARAIHQLSGRRDGAFVKLNCAAIPTGLLESELFGHERGAFTGAVAQRIGRFELANQGTVFLDEIGEIPLELQPKLLRVLQEREFERLGGNRTLRTDARLIAATNRDLGHLVEQARFRPDLYYRLNVFPVLVPPLRDRREDIPMLVRHFAQQFARRMKRTIETIPVDAMRALTRYDWPGNIRELQNLIERAVILSAGPTLSVPMEALTPRGLAAAGAGPAAMGAGADGAETLLETDRRHILAALHSSNWVLSGPAGAAARLGMKRSTLQFRMRKLGIERPGTRLS
jgi:formate hydrogenlyase transcriptional activator